jgi:hypothetical protein
MFQGFKKENKRQKHLDELEKSFMDLTSPKNCLNEANNVSNTLIMKKLQRYVNQNRENAK